jgi:cell division protein FtsB
MTMHWVNRILLAGLVAALVAFGPKQLELAAESDDLSRVTAERDELVSGNDTLREEIRLLEAEVAALKSDPAEVARIAREDLNLVLPGEVVFEVEHVDAQPPESRPPSGPK